jgi:hypothetical protein
VTLTPRFVGRWQVSGRSGAWWRWTCCARSLPPTYLITGRFEDRPDRPGYDDLVTAELIERARLNQDLDAARTARAVAESDEAALSRSSKAGAFRGS